MIPQNLFSARKRYLKNDTSRTCIYGSYPPPPRDQASDQAEPWLPNISDRDLQKKAPTSCWFLRQHRSNMAPIIRFLRTDQEVIKLLRCLCDERQFQTPCNKRQVETTPSSLQYHILKTLVSLTRVQFFLRVSFH